MKINYRKRKIIEQELQNGTEITEIAKMVNCTRYGVYSELKRSGMDRETYNAERAQALANKRKGKSNESVGHDNVVS